MTTYHCWFKLAEDEVLNLVIEYDVNGDGTIDFDEFMEMMKKQAEHQVREKVELGRIFFLAGCRMLDIRHALLDNPVIMKSD